MYLCPTHTNIKYSRSGRCPIAIEEFKQCRSCGERNPKERMGIHAKGGCGGDIVTIRIACELTLIPERSQ